MLVFHLEANITDLIPDESTSEWTHQQDLIAYGLREDCVADIVSRLNGADENADIWEILLERLRTYPNLGYHREIHSLLAIETLVDMIKLGTPGQYKNAAVCSA